MASVGLYGNSTTGVVPAASGAESTGLYGNNVNFGGSYFEWFIFQQSDAQPATPTGGSWSFTTNSGTPPTGWSGTPFANPTNKVWVSIALVNSKNTTALAWSAPGLFSYSSGLPILSGSGAPQPTDGQSDQLWIQTGTTPETIWFKQSGTWTRLSGSSLYVDLTNNQTIAGTKTFSSQIQGSISGTASNVTGVVGIANGGTGATTASSARAALSAAASGANNDITSLSGITGAISTADYVQFDTTYATALGVGQVGWDGNNTLGLGMAGGQVVQKIGEDLFYYIKASSAITKGQVIMFTGAVGASGVATGAPATGVSDGSYIMGIAAENIALNGFGLVQFQGTLKGFDTSAFSNGDILWYNPAVTGGLTATKPSAPNIKVQIAAVINSGNGGSGSVLIRVTAGSVLGGTDSNVQFGILSNNDVIRYDSTAGYWTNVPSTTAAVTTFSGGTTGLTPATATSGAVTLGGTLALVNGGTGATTASGARTNFGLGTSAVLNAGVANGVATLDAGGTIPLSQIPASIQGGVSYQGTWNASTNTPTLTSGVGTKGYYYVVSVAGSTNLNGITDWKIGDWAIFNGTAWEKVDNTDAVTSVNGYTGSVVLSYTDVNAPSTTGTNATGTWGINITGNAATATTSTNVSGGTASVTTLAASGNVTLSGGTANGVAYLNGSKVLTTGSALTFDGSTFSTTASIFDVNGVSLWPAMRFRSSNNTSTTFEIGRDSSGLAYFSNSGSQAFYWNINASEQMRLTSTGLGIGTSSFSSRLAVASGVSSGSSATIAAFTGAGNGTNFTINSPGATSAYLYNAIQGDTALRAEAGSMRIGVQSGSGVIAFGNTTSEFGRFDSSGNLGLGVTPSAWYAFSKAIDIGSGGAIQGRSNTAGTFELATNAYLNSSGNWTYKASSVAANLFAMSNGSYAWNTAPSGTAGNAISFTQAMTLDASGQLGIGTTSPDGKFVVLGSAGSNPYSHFKDASGADFFIQSVGNSDCRTGTASNHPWLMFTNGSERARIDSSGNLLVGTTSAAGKITIAQTASSAVGLGVDIQATSTKFCNFTYQGSVVGSISYNGTLTVYATTSDQRVKHDIVDAPEASGLIDAIKVRSFKWNANDSEQRYGFVAQELVTVAPEAVHQPEDPEQMMAVDYSKLVPMLVKELQSLRARVAQLESN